MKFGSVAVVLLAAGLCVACATDLSVDNTIVRADFLTVEDAAADGLNASVYLPRSEQGAELVESDGAELVGQEPLETIEYPRSGSVCLAYLASGSPVEFGEGKYFNIVCPNDDPAVIQARIDEGATVLDVGKRVTLFFSPNRAYEWKANPNSEPTIWRYTEPEQSGLLAGRAFPQSNDVCRVIEQAGETAGLAEYGYLLIGCPKHETGAISDRLVDGARVVAHARHWVLLQIRS